MAPVPAADRCASPPVPGAPDTLVVGFTAPVDPGHAPLPRNPDERVLFRQLYHLLVRRDCTGAIRPDLAARWERSGDRWLFHLSPGELSDGSRITAPLVLAAWSAPGRVPPASLGVTSVTPVDDSTLALGFAEPDSIPPALSGPALAVAGTTPANGWPAATGPYTPQADRLAPRQPGLQVIRWRIAPGDARDLLDAGADLLVTRDPRVLAYAEARPDYTALPLPWDRRYILLLPGRDGQAAWPDSASRARLARDAVREESRPAQVPSGWGLACGQAPPPAGPPPDRLVVPAGDPTALLLAQRIVALVAAGGREPWLQPLRPASGSLGLVEVPRKQLAATPGLGYVLAVGTVPAGGCLDAPLPAGAAVPLIETRARAIIRNGRVRITADADGAIRLLPPEPPR